jgi:hypothetical protein
MDGSIVSAATATEKDLAVNGGEKVIEEFEAKRSHWGLKVGSDEFLALADVWGYSKEAQARIAEIVAEEDPYVNPRLARYYKDTPSQVSMLEASARELFGANYALAVNSGHRR